MHQAVLAESRRRVTAALTGAPVGPTRAALVGLALAALLVAAYLVAGALHG